MRLILLAWLSFLPGLAVAAQTLTLGVFAYRTQEITAGQYQPLADYLSSRLPDTRVQLAVLDPKALADALEHKRIDLLLGSPSHYVELRYRNELTGVLATLIRYENGYRTNKLGGVIIRRADRKDLESLAQLRGKRIATPGPDFLGGYRVQALALLEAGIDASRDVIQVRTENQDATLEAVLKGEADAGFLRTGIIESRITEGTLDRHAIEVIRPRMEPGFPYRLSTYLYPEWPFVAMPHVDMRTVQQIAAALFSLDPDHPAARAAGIAGFSPPLDYLPVENLAKTLHLPPFDTVPEFSLADVGQKYWPAVVIGTLGLAIILILTTVLARRNRQLQRALDAREAANLRVHTSERLLRTLFDSVPMGMVLTGHDNRIVDCNQAAENLLGVGRDQLLGQHCGTEGWQIRRPDGSEMAAEEFPCARALAEGRNIADVEMEVEVPGGSRHLAVSALPFEHDNYQLLVTFVDITERKRSEDMMRQAAGVFEHAREGIFITDAQARILDANRAFTRITGYTRDEVIGRNPRILSSGRQDREYYADMWQSLIEKGFWTGEIWNRRKNGELYAELQTISAVRDGGGRVTRYIALFSDITSIKEHQKQLEQIAHYDALTRLPNRFLLADRMRLAMARSRRTGDMLAVCLMDLDGFKPVNDSLGHQAGDVLLKEIAHRLQEVIRADDTAARIGGDEFALLLGGFKNAEQCELTLQRLLASVAQPMTIDGRPARVTGSLGVTFYQGNDIDADQLLRHADQAMYAAKEKGKNRYHIFDTAVVLRLRANMELYRRIGGALERNQFCLYYQPKVDCRTGQVTGLEALIRWNHPVLGLRSPMEFIPLIEHDDMVIRLGEWVIHEALRQIAEWRQQGLDLKVSVNVTARQLLHGNFGARLAELLGRHEPDMASRLEIELVETAALDDINMISQVMRQPQQLGVRFALDDFGTGYSSLVHLKRLAVDALKIDQSFVRDMLDDGSDLAIVQGVIGLASAFQHQVIAEGVETTEHILMLLELGCDIMQGHGIARPMPAAAVPSWVRNFVPDPRWQAASAHFPSRSDFDLLLMEVMHRHWLERWRLAGLSPEERPAPGYGECRLGQWCRDVGAARYGHLPEYAVFDRAHHDVHHIAEAMLDAYRTNDPATIADNMARLEAASAELIEAIRGLRAALATINVHNGYRRLPQETPP